MDDQRSSVRVEIVVHATPNGPQRLLPEALAGAPGMVILAFLVMGWHGASQAMSGAGACMHGRWPVYMKSAALAHDEEVRGARTLRVTSPPLVSDE